MGKVGVEQLRHTGSGKDIFIQINFYTKTKQFQVSNMPEDFTEWYGAKVDREETRSYQYSGLIKGDSYDSCVKSARDLWNEFCDVDITEEKIIAYKLKVNSNEKQEISFAPNKGLALEYRIMYRIKIGADCFLANGPYEKSKKKSEGQLGWYGIRKEQGKDGLYDWQKIPYTEEAENFFKTVDSGLDTMITKVIGFFGSDSSVFLENLNSGKLLT